MLTWVKVQLYTPCLPSLHMRSKNRARACSAPNSSKMAEILLAGKRLSELKVTELKAELEKRGLQKKGVKSVLLNRLKTAILREALLTQVS